MNKPQPKVAVLTVPYGDWSRMSPQQQMLYIGQQILGFMASGYFGEMEGMQIKVINTDDIRRCAVVFQVGGKPTPAPSIIQ